MNGTAAVSAARRGSWRTGLARTLSGEGLRGLMGRDRLRQRQIRSCAFVRHRDSLAREGWLNGSA